MMEYWNVDLEGCYLSIYLIAEGRSKISHCSMFPERVASLFQHSIIPVFQQGRDP